MNFPDNLLYTSHDEWVLRDGDVITVGLSDFAQDALGELVHIEMPEVGTGVDADEMVCEVESVKAVAEVYAPCSGEVIAINESLEDDVENVNSAPYDSWLFKLRISDDGPLADLISAEAYKAKVADS